MTCKRGSVVKVQEMANFGPERRLTGTLCLCVPDKQQQLLKSEAASPGQFRKRAVRAEGGGWFRELMEKGQSPRGILQHSGQEHAFWGQIEFESMSNHLPFQFLSERNFIFQSISFLIRSEKLSLVLYHFPSICGFVLNAGSSCQAKGLGREWQVGHLLHTTAWQTLLINHKSLCSGALLWHLSPQIALLAATPSLSELTCSLK